MILSSNQMKGEKSMLPIVPLEYKRSRDYKMLLILKYFRKGMSISSRQITQEMQYSVNHLYTLENARAVISETALKKYASLIAKNLEFDEENFYNEIQKEAESIQDETSQISIIMAISRVICANILYDAGKETQQTEGDTYYNATLILSCFRRMLKITARQVTGTIGGTDISTMELRMRNPSIEFVRKYANYIAEKMQYNNQEYFREKLREEASIIRNTNMDSYANALISLGKIVSEMRKPLLKS